MKALLIDTCGSEASIALADTEASPAIVASIAMTGRTASERLIGHVREAMARQKWLLKDLTAIAVVRGPGSFTGVRVGLSAAKGLSEVSGVPLLAVSRLALLAAAIPAQEGHPNGEEREICAILDAGRSEFYCGRYAGRRCLGEALLGLDEALKIAKASKQNIFCEAKAQQAFVAFSERNRSFFVPEPTAADALPLIYQRLLEADYEDAAHLDANYLRSSDQQIFAKAAAPADPKTIVRP